MKNFFPRSPLVMATLACAIAGVSSVKTVGAAPLTFCPVQPAKTVIQPIRLAQLDGFDMGLQSEDDVALTPRERLDLTLLCADLCKGRYEGNLAQQALGYANCMAKCLKGHKELGFYETEESSSELDNAVLEDENVLILEVD